ncbi:hypothetical protein [Pseudomonas sp. HMWF021]|uniref:hypothetical protein n=1 Tax=Pseudomonas sp. HMWF021 TaxID=2056857 RepID=UPI000D3A79BC|nr:hypothetical protein [Pseudomonas sp. HMWF021]PTT27170.1 hypothetical protein DBR18_20460 [Pseudomonas sp. HMWF021]
MDALLSGRVENQPDSSSRKEWNPLFGLNARDAFAKRENRQTQIAGKKNPKQLMEAWDLKMHKPWW